MKWLVLALLLAPPDEPAVEVQRPGEPVLWALDWATPPSCPTRADLVERVRSYIPAIEEPPLEVPRARLRIEASVELLEGEWAVRMRMSGEQGSTERSFSAASCDELADAVALVAAVSLDPVLTAREVADVRAAVVAVEEPEPEPEPEPELDQLDEPDAESISAPPASDDVEPEPPRNFQMALRLGGGGGFGPTTTGYGALAAGVALFGPRWRWSIDGGGWLPRTIRTDQAAGRFWGWWVGTRGCFVPHRDVVEFPLCGGIELGQVAARGLAPALNPRGASYLWAAASVSGGVSWVITDRVAIVTDVAALVPFVRGDFRVSDQILQRLAPVGVRATLGIELRL
jgi:hypothetical protein